MADDVAIRVDDVSKSFKLPHEKHGSVKNAFVNLFRGKTSYEEQDVLKDISFEIMKGEFFGVVGRNGSGKSTLLKLLAGIYSPDKGGIAISGKLTPFIELGVGFNPELTGRENVFLNGALLGFSRKEMEYMYDEIVGFAELEKFMDQKLKNYSSGMQVRLAFAISIQAKTEILVLDEVLAVGDALFQQKCFKHFNKLKKENKTVLLVSHDINVLRQFCSKGLLLENGEIKLIGSMNDVLDEYVDVISKKEALGLGRKKFDNRRGTGKIQIKDIKVIDGKKKNIKKEIITDDGDIIIKINYLANEDCENPTYGIVIKNGTGDPIFSSNNLWMSVKSKSLKKGDKSEVVWTVPNIFNTGEYSISPAVADSTGTETYDWIDEITTFGIRRKVNSSAISNPNHKMEIQ